MNTTTTARFSALCAAAVVTLGLFSQVTGLARPAAHTELLAAAPAHVAGDAQGTLR
jgi:hypothetical protein